MVEDNIEDFDLTYYTLTDAQELGDIAYEMQAILDHRTGEWE